MCTIRGNVNLALSRSLGIKKVKLRRTGLENFGSIYDGNLAAENRAAFVSVNFYKKVKIHDFCQLSIFLNSDLIIYFSPNFF